MNTLLELSWRGALMLAVVASLDRWFAARINARVRRAWWLLVPAAFLVSVPLPVLPAARLVIPPAVPTQGEAVALVQIAARPGVGAAVSVPVQRSGKRWPLALVLSGSALYLFSVLARTAAALRRFRGLPACTDPALLLVLEECRAEAGVIKRVGLVVSGRVPTPLLLGWLRPRILLPQSLVASLSHAQLRGVLFHELAHVRAWDVPCTVLFTVVCALHWFNPAAHLALRAWMQIREEAADETAVNLLGSSFNLFYGETLLHVLRASHGPGQVSPALLAVVDSIGQLRKRLLMIKQHSSKSPRLLLSSAVFVAAAAVLLHPVRAAVADDPPTAVFSSKGTQPVTVMPSTDQKDLAIQVAGDTVAVLLAGRTQMQGDRLTVVFPAKGATQSPGNVASVVGTSMTRRSLDVMAWQGAVEARVDVPGHSPVVLTGCDLIFVRQEPMSTGPGVAEGLPVPTPFPGKFDASGNPVMPPLKGWELWFSGVPVAIVPAGAKSGRSMNIDSTKGAFFATKTGVATFSGDVTLVFNAPGQAPLKLTGEDLAMVPRW